MANPFNVGRDCKVTLLWGGLRVDMPTVTGFQAQQNTHQISSTPLNSVPKFVDIENGWRGSFNVDRNNSGLDDLVASKEAGFWDAGIINQGTIYQYIRETDGTTTTWEFSGASIRLPDAGNYRAEEKVSQRLEFSASMRRKI